MTNYDVRNEIRPVIDTITFADEQDDFYSVVRLVNLDDRIAICQRNFHQTDGETYVVISKDKVDILNMIKALETAIDLGWTEQ